MQDERLRALRERIENALDHYLPSPSLQPERLHQAMRYSTLEAGKRVRPLLTYLTGQCFGVALTDLDGAACAVELIHSYSLIHDDLPAMDDDDLRRGKPTNHKAFDEATAILAGDALHTLAFEVLINHPAPSLPASARLSMLNVLAAASGSLGMGGGQAIDIEATGEPTLPLSELIHMHQMKTGRLICCSIRLGALMASNASQSELTKLEQFGEALGLAFQIRDDILDIESDSKTLGKPQGSDLDLGKVTFPALVGMDKAKAMADEYTQKGLKALNSIDRDTTDLEAFARYLLVRSH